MSRLYRQFDAPVDHHRTTMPDDTYCAWAIHSGELRVMMLTFADDDTPAYVWPIEDEQFLPACVPGHVAFRGEQPSLEEARKRFPDHQALWDAVDADFRRAITPTHPTGCIEARKFSPAEESAWLESLTRH